MYECIYFIYEWSFRGIYQFILWNPYVLSQILFVSNMNRMLKVFLKTVYKLQQTKRSKLSWPQSELDIVSLIVPMIMITNTLLVKLFNNFIKKAQLSVKIFSSRNEYIISAWLILNTSTILKSIQEWRNDDVVKGKIVELKSPTGTCQSWFRSNIERSTNHICWFVCYSLATSCSIEWQVCCSPTWRLLCWSWIKENHVSLGWWRLLLCWHGKPLSRDLGCYGKTCWWRSL